MLIPYFLSPGSELPSEIKGEIVSWRSSSLDTMNKQGKLVWPEDDMSPEFQLTAIGQKYVHSFKVRMLGLQSQWLAGYTRQADENSNIYSIFVGSSVHFALRREDDSFEPLNSNYGVLFAKADYSKSVAGETKLLRLPRLFRLHQDGFGLLATPLDYESNDDSVGELIYFQTKDFVHYEERGRIKLSHNKVLDYSCELDAGTLNYRIGWTEEDGETRYVTTKDFIQFEMAKLGEKFRIRIENLNLQGTESGQVIALTPSEVAYLQHKLGRVTHVAVDVPLITLAQDDTSFDINNVRVKSSYSDGSFSFKRITTEPAELAKIDFHQPGVYEIKAAVYQHQFPYPMMRARPDPNVLLYNGRYYFISTDDDNHNRKLFIRSAETLEGLEDGKAEECMLWNGGIQDGDRIGQHWAPELHEINGRLYCFLAISINNNWHGVQAHVACLEGDNPMNPEHWGTPRRVIDRNGKYISDLAEGERNISLDMTYFSHNGKSYVCWSQPKWFGNEQELASLYIATVDPDQPWILTSDPVRICRNEYGWDRNGNVASGVAEGPFALKRDDKLYMVFSGSNVGPKYNVGLLVMDNHDDPMNPSAWQKLNYPVMHALSHPDEFGPGHNSFVQDEFGDWFNVYHACDVDGGFRNASIRPIHFRFDGSPVLDMKAEEELHPELKQITLTIRIV